MYVDVPTFAPSRNEKILLDPPAASLRQNAATEATLRSGYTMGYSYIDPVLSASQPPDNACILKLHHYLEECEEDQTLEMEGSRNILRRL